ncbi:hypothetical protein BD289DRAFT_234015, partial [Coniella lustricola]
MMMMMMMMMMMDGQPGATLSRQDSSMTWQYHQVAAMHVGRTMEKHNHNHRQSSHDSLHPYKHTASNNKSKKTPHHNPIYTHTHNMCTDQCAR